MFALDIFIRFYDQDFFLALQAFHAHGASSLILVHRLIFYNIYKTSWAFPGSKKYVITDKFVLDVFGEKKMLFLNSLSLEGISVLTSVTFHFLRMNRKNNIISSEKPYAFSITVF